MFNKFYYDSEPEFDPSWSPPDDDEPVNEPIYVVDVEACNFPCSILKYSSEEERADKQNVLSAVRIDGRALQYASEELRGDKEIVIAAVRQNQRALKYATKALRFDTDVHLAFGE